MKILAIGDVVSESGCEYLRKVLPRIKRENKIDFCIANGENSALGNGITAYSADFLFSSGVDFITSGNHAFRKKEIYSYFDETKNIIRPANFFPGCPGRGYDTVDFGFARIAVINLSGMAYMPGCSNPFIVIDDILEQVNSCKIKIVDFHAEATAEKRAMGFYLDGKVSAVFGTHTHVLTSDAQVLPKGTGYITDLGMTAGKNSVLGINPETSISWLKTGMPAKFEPAEGEMMLCGCIFDIDEKTGACIWAKAIEV